MPEVRIPDRFEKTNFFIKGITEFTKINNLVTGKEREARNKDSMFPKDNDYYTITIKNCEYEKNMSKKQPNSELGKELFDFLVENDFKFRKSDSYPEQELRYTQQIDANHPKVELYEIDKTSNKAHKIETKKELDKDQEIYALISCYKSKTYKKCYITIRAVFVENPKWYGVTQEDILHNLGFTLEDTVTDNNEEDSNTVKANEDTKTNENTKNNKEDNTIQTFDNIIDDEETPF